MTVCRAALVVAAVLSLSSPPATAICNGEPPVCAVCQTPTCSGSVYICVNQANGTACNDGNACTSGDHCSSGTCVGTPSCVPPGVPGPITGPSTSATGSYSLSWGAAASGPVDYYQLYENNVGIFSALGLTASIAGKLAGSYTYQVRACNSSGCSAFTSGFLVSVVTPGTPGPITVPTTNTTASYTLSWG